MRSYFVRLLRGDLELAERLRLAEVMWHGHVGQDIGHKPPAKAPNLIHLQMKFEERFSEGLNKTAAQEVMGISSVTAFADDDGTLGSKRRERAQWLHDELMSSMCAREVKGAAVQLAISFDLDDWDRTP